MDIPKLRPELHLTATLHLLSAIAEQGKSPAKVAAMLSHLHRLLEHQDLDAALLDTIARIAMVWHENNVPPSESFPLSVTLH